MAKSHYFDEAASLYDKLQPVIIESYSTYHALALDLLPDDDGNRLRILDLGCGTAEFLNQVMIRRPESDAVAIDYGESALAQAAAKPALSRGNVQFIQRDLNDGTPEDLGEFDVVSSFSATHHLLDANKNRLIKQVADSLKPGGRFIFMDAMFEMFDDDVFRQIKERELRNRKIRLTEAGVSEEYERLEQIKASLDSESPERDRFASVQHYRHSLDEAGFRSVDHIWHFWMEYLFISFK